MSIKAASEYPGQPEGIWGERYSKMFAEVTVRQQWGGKLKYHKVLTEPKFQLVRTQTS